MINSGKSTNAVEMFVATTDVDGCRTTLNEFYTEWVQSETDYDLATRKIVTEHFKDISHLLDICDSMKDIRKEEVSKCVN